MTNTNIVNVTRYCPVQLGFQLYLTEAVVESCVDVAQAVYQQLGIHPADRMDLLIQEVVSHLKQNQTQEDRFSFWRYPADGNELTSMQADLSIRPFIDQDDRPSLLIDLVQPVLTIWQTIRLRLPDQAV